MIGRQRCRQNVRFGSGQDMAWLRAPSRQGSEEIEDSLTPTFMVEVAHDNDVE